MRWRLCMLLVGAALSAGEPPPLAGSPANSTAGNRTLTSATNAPETAEPSKATFTTQPETGAPALDESGGGPAWWQLFVPLVALFFLLVLLMIICVWRAADKRRKKSESEQRAAHRDLSQLTGPQKQFELFALPPGELDEPPPRRRANPAVVLSSDLDDTAGRLRTDTLWARPVLSATTANNDPIATHTHFEQLAMSRRVIESSHPVPTLPLDGSGAMNPQGSPVSSLASPRSPRFDPYAQRYMDANACIIEVTSPLQLREHEPPGIETYYRSARLAGSSACAIVVNKVVDVRRRNDDTLRAVNNYRVVHELARGQYGEVYCVRAKTGAGAVSCWGCAEKEEEVALKVVRRAGAFAVEHKVLIRAQHPHIVRMLEYIDDPYHSNIYLVFEILDQPIAKLGPDGRMADAKCLWGKQHAMQLFPQVIQAVLHLHSVGVIHRDIKPENVVYSTSRHDHVKLIDFGESFILRDGALGDDSFRATRGTPFFQASEALTGQYCPGQLSDVWALGALLFLMCTGYVPFGAGSTSLPQLYTAIREETLQLPAKVGAALAELLTGMLDRNLTTRFTLPAVAAHHFFAPAAGQPRCAGRTGRHKHLVLPGCSLSTSLNTAVSTTSSNTAQSSSPVAHPKSATPLKNPLSPGFESLKMQLYHSPMEDNKPPLCATASKDAPVGSTPSSPLSALLADDSVCAGTFAGQQTILIVEDTHFERVMLTKMLSRIALVPGAVAVTEMCDGAGAVDAAVEAAACGRPYGLVILDMFLADMNGVEVARRVREAESEEGLWRTPTLMMTTARERPANLEDVMDALSLKVITKPIRPEQVWKILRWLGVRTIPYEALGDVKEELKSTHHAAYQQYMCNIERENGSITSTPPPCDSRLEVSGYTIGSCGSPPRSAPRSVFSPAQSPSEIFCSREDRSENEPSDDDSSHTPSNTRE